MGRDVRDASRAGHASDGLPNLTGTVVRVVGRAFSALVLSSPTRPRRSLGDCFRSSPEVKRHAAA